jgi:hypothetical protein
MAAPKCEHDQTLARWERDLLDQPFAPRVVRDRSEFKVGQLVALTMSGAEAIAKVTHAEDGQVGIVGRYLHARPTTPAPRPPTHDEVEHGYWLILANPPENR